MQKLLKTISIIITTIILSVIVVQKIDTINLKLNIDFNLSAISSTMTNQLNNQLEAIHLPNSLIDFGRSGKTPLNESNDNDSDEDNVEWDEFNKNDNDHMSHLYDPKLFRKNHLDELLISAILDKIPTPPPES